MAKRKRGKSTSTNTPAANDPPARACANGELPLDELRTAVLHLVELAAAYEHLGLPANADPAKNQHLIDAHGWESLYPDDSSADDAKCLRDVAEILIRHRARQRRRQRDAMIEAFAFGLAGAFAGFKGDEDVTAFDLEQRVRELFAAFGYELTETELDELVADRETITEDGGPQQAASFALARALGRSETTIRTIRSQPIPLTLGRHAFGRFVPRKARAAYVQRVHDELLRETGAVPPLRLAALRDLGERSGRVVDRHVEALVHDIVSIGPIWQALKADRATVIAELVEEARVRLRGAFAHALEVGSALLPTAGLPSALLELARNRIAAIARGDHDHASAFDEEVERAIEEAAAAEVDAWLLEGVRAVCADELDLPPVTSVAPGSR